MRANAELSDPINKETAIVRKAVLLTIAIGLSSAGCRNLTERSVAVSLGSSDYDMVFTVAWGTGMHQQFTLQRQGASLSTVSSRWIEIFDKPYNSGATLYVSDDGTTYYLGAFYTLLTIEPGEGTLETTCDQEALPKRTPLAELLLNSEWETDEKLDPGAPRINTYIPTEESSSALPDPLPPSKYYEGVRYIGRFGVTDDDGRGRGSGVGFAPATIAPEPRLGLEFSCG
jgi:hypothetical protein